MSTAMLVVAILGIAGPVVIAVVAAAWRVGGRIGLLTLEVERLRTEMAKLEAAMAERSREEARAAVAMHVEAHHSRPAQMGQR